MANALSRGWRATSRTPAEHAALDAERGVAIVVEAGAHEGEGHDDDRQQAGADGHGRLPAEPLRQGRQQERGDHAAHRHAGLLQGEDEVLAVARREAEQEMGGRGVRQRVAAPEGGRGEDGQRQLAARHGEHAEAGQGQRDDAGERGAPPPHEQAGDAGERGAGEVDDADLVADRLGADAEGGGGACCEGGKREDGEGRKALHGRDGREQRGHPLRRKPVAWRFPGGRTKAGRCCGGTRRFAGCLILIGQLSRLRPIRA